MIDFGKYTWTIVSAYGGTACLITLLVIMTILKSKKVKKELFFAEKEKRDNAKSN
ncbi:MAG: heme exporter CcmD [Rhodobacteraceae bacterium]|nr:heme exporter CcmD [Paracoccaceae bacterium]